MSCLDSIRMVITDENQSPAEFYCNNALRLSTPLLPDTDQSQRGSEVLSTPNNGVESTKNCYRPEQYWTPQPHQCANDSVSHGADKRKNITTTKVSKPRARLQCLLNNPLDNHMTACSRTDGGVVNSDELTNAKSDSPSWYHGFYKFKMLMAWAEMKLAKFERVFLLKLGMSICGWYLTSISLTLFNKLIWTQLPHAKENTASLIALQSAVMSIVIAGLCFARVIDLSFATLKNVLLGFLPMAALAAADIAFTNSAYSCVSVSVVVVIKSSGPCLTYLCGVLMGLTTFNLKKVLCLVWIAVTVSMTVKEMKLGEAASVGILLSAMSVLASAVRWTMTHMFIKPTPSTKCQYNKIVKTKIVPMQLVAIQQPLILLSLMPIVMYHDAAWHSLFSNNSTDVVRSPEHSAALPEITGSIFWLSVYAIVSSSLAFGVVASEIYIIKYTGSTTLTVSGIGKETLVLLCSVILFNDELNMKTLVAIAMTLLGIFCYAMINATNDEITVDICQPVKEEQVCTTVLSGHDALHLLEVEDQTTPNRRCVLSASSVGMEMEAL